MTDRVRVVVIGDRGVTKEALESATVQPGVRVCGTFARGDQALVAIGDSPAEVALLDMDVVGDAIETIRGLKQRRPDVAVIALGAAETPKMVIAAIDAGASGYLVTTTPVDDVVAGCRQARAGLSPLSPSTARLVLERLRARVSVSPDRTMLDALTAREKEVLTYLGEGFTYSMIATVLGIQVGTVQTYVKSLYEKLDIGSKAEAAAIAARCGLVRRRDG